MLLNKGIQYLYNNRIPLVIFIFCYLQQKMFSQNLVQNYSFENISSCPNFNSEIYKALPWYSPDYTFAIAELYNSCSTNIESSVPQSSQGYQFPRTGSGYAGFAVKIGTKYRDYIEQKISAPLIANKKYCINFYVCLSDTFCNAFGAFGVYFSKDSVRTNSSDVLPFTPQFQNPDTAYATDKVGWTLISGVYKAKGGEQFITIGNFNNDSLTKIKLMGCYYDWSYYYIDDVSLTEVIEANAGPDIALCNGGRVPLGNNAIPGVSYRWRPGTGLNDTTAAMPLANPSITTSYTLSINYSLKNCVEKITDTVTVFVNDCPNVFVANVFSPNYDGKNDVLKIEGTGITMVYWGIYDRWGNLVFETYDQAHSWDGTKKGNPCNHDVYMYYLRGTLSDGKLVEQTGNVTLIR